jgi:hypothetical protein
MSLITFKIELNVSADRVLAQLESNNAEMEAQVKQGIEEAINELVENGELKDAIKEATKKDILSIANQICGKWETKQKLLKAISDKVDVKMEDYANKIADSITKNL